VSSLVISTLEENANAIFQAEVLEVGKAVSYVEGVEVRVDNHRQGPGQSNWEPWAPKMAATTGQEPVLVNHRKFLKIIFFPPVRHLSIRKRFH
jgi:hypothetical protein